MPNVRSPLRLPPRLTRTWKRGLDLAWPVATEQVLRTLMRTTDIVVAGFFAPAAIAAIGLADLYGRLLVRLGLGIGDATIALSSQDTGSGATANRDEAVTQAILLGILAGIPFMIFGALLSYWAIAILGAEREVVRLGGAYLAITMLIAPVVHVTFIGARAIQGTGDTRTPMVINIIANATNIVLTVVLAFGLGPIPALHVVGIALATAVGETLAAVLFVATIYGPRTNLGFVRPSNPTITKQLVIISAPRVAESLDLLAEFPFNAILLVFGTEVNAAYHIGRRLYQQLASPISRGFGVAANILVGQALGRGHPDTAHYNGLAIAGLGLLIIGMIGLGIIAAAPWLVLVFTRDPVTIPYAIRFVQAFAVALWFIAPYLVLAGGLRGGSETLAPFVAKVTGAFVFLLGFTYAAGVHLGLGVTAAYLAIIIDFAWRSCYVGTIYHRRRWLDRGTRLMVDRGSLHPDTHPED